MSDDYLSDAQADHLVLGKLIDELTSAERKALRAGLSKVHDEVVSQAVRHVKTMLSVGAGVLTLAMTAFGFISWSGIRSDIIKTAVDHYTSDNKTRDDIVKQSSAILENVENLSKRKDEYEKEIEKGQASLAELRKSLEDNANTYHEELRVRSVEVMAGITRDLEEIRAMLSQVRDEYKYLRERQERRLHDE